MSDDGIVELGGERDGETNAPFFGIVYGEIVYLFAIVGMVFGVVGVALHMGCSSLAATTSDALNTMWDGAAAAEVWKVTTGVLCTGHWYLRELRTGNGLAMFGIALCCSAAVFGMWGGCVAMFTRRGRERKLYIILGFIVLMLLLLSVVGASGR